MRILASVLVCAVMALGFTACSSNRAIEEAPSKMRVGTVAYAVISSQSDAMSMQHRAGDARFHPDTERKQFESEEGTRVIGVSEDLAFQAAQVLSNTPRGGPSEFVPEDATRYGHPIVFAFFLPSDDGDYWHCYTLAAHEHRADGGVQYEFGVTERRVYLDVTRNFERSGGEGTTYQTASSSSVGIVNATPELDEIWNRLLFSAAFQGALDTGAIDLDELRE